MSRTKDFVLNCTSRSFILLLDLVESKIKDLDKSCDLLDIKSSDLKVYNEYLDILIKLRDLWK